MIITLAATLDLARDIDPALAARRCHDPFGLVRRFRQGTMLAFARRPLAGLGLAAPAAATLVKVVLRGRNMRILRSLARLPDQRLQLRNPRGHPLDHLVLGKQQIVLLGFGQNMKRGWCHPQDESNSDSQRKPFLPTP